MKKLALLVLLAVVLVVSGCNDELKSCKNDNTVLLNDMEQFRQDFETEKLTLEQEIINLKEENIEIQTVAMQSFMKMLTKQIEKDRQTQEKLQAQIDHLEGVNNQLNVRLGDLESKLQALQKPVDKPVAVNQ
jgi:chromosome segregation ATPase